MSYSAGEALILTALQAISGSVWTSVNTSRGKWGMLNSGKSDHYAILKPGTGYNEFIGLSQARRTYETVIEVWQSYKDDGTSVTNLESYMEGIIAKFDAERLLGDTGNTVEDAKVTRWTEIQEMWKQGGGPRWLRMDFYIEWKEDSNVTFTD